MPTVPKVNATGGGINPQLDVLVGRMINSRGAPAYDPPGLTAEAASALGARPAKRRVPIEQRAQQTVSLAEMLAATTSERQGRLIDRDEAGSMEKKKREGYF